jgi:multimeric flavodoxin WrbA
VLKIDKLLKIDRKKKTAKNVVVLSGSPRRGGNSDLLCDRFAEGACDAGNKVEKIFLRDKKIK